VRKKIAVSVIIPCLNEEKAVGKCVVNALHTLKRKSLRIENEYEVIVIDNGSTDRSIDIAKKKGATVIIETKKGYGFALQKGILETKGEIIIMGDADGTYDFSEMPKLIEKVKKGYDLVLGSRLKGTIKKGAMPFLHRFVGTPSINLLFRLFFNIKLSDSQSGFRAFRKKTVGAIKFKTGGMEFASEMLFKVKRRGYKIAEVPISYFPREGTSKLSPFRDAWRHIKFMLLFSPLHLFVIPGAVIFIIGILFLVRLSIGGVYFIGRSFDIHTMLVFAFISILGFQIIFLGLFAKTYAFLFLDEKDKVFEKLLTKFTLEKGIVLGSSIALLGLIIFGYVFYIWFKGGFGALAEERLLILSVTLAVLGVQGIFSSFFFSLIGGGEK
jgi:glycosyltransferase involved in cell wall biosynthesis